MKITRYFGVLTLLSIALYFPLQARNTDKISQKTLELIAEKAAEKAATKMMEKCEHQVKAHIASSTTTPATKTDTAGKTTDEKDKTNQKTVKKDVSTANSLLMSIGTGAVGGNYFVLGELVGGAISHPTGSLPCEKGGTCGVSNLQALNITSAGSMANIAALEQDKISSGFVQSDIAYWAYTGSGIFENKEKLSDLRAIASLYPESIHIVANKKITDISELKGKRVSVGARKSGTLSQARLVLDAYDLSEDDMGAEYLNNQQSIKKLKNGELDAMFFSVGAPAPALMQLFSNNSDFTLLSINEAAQQKMLSQGYYFSPHTIEKGTYPNVAEVQTVSVFALWLTSSKADKKLIYQMTKALWSETSRQLLNSSFIGRQVLIDNSLKGIGIPLHDGAKQYYNEIGKRY